VVDWENPREISFYNLNGTSIANSFQIELNYEPIKKLDTRIAYKFFDVSTDYKSGNLSKPLQPKHRFFINSSYETQKNSKDGYWRFDTTYNLVGKQRLPSTTNNPMIYQLKKYSNSFSTVNTQITKVFNDYFEVYAGGENITNYKQPNPIIASNQPFSAYFDSTIVYAPIFGANYYAGLRFNMN